MNNKSSSFTITHDLKVMTPRETQAYLVSIPEWEFLKERISKIGGMGSFYHTIGSVFLGASLSGVVAGISTELCSPEIATCTRDIVVWAFSFVTGISGLLSLHFGKLGDPVDCSP